MKRLMVADIKVKSIYDINLNNLKDIGIKGFFFDIDNTLEEYATKQPTIKLIEFIKHLDDCGFKIGILSNAKSERAEIFVNGFPKNDYPNVYFVGKAGKPLKKGYNELSKKIGLELKNIAMVGDQIFTDILGGNRSGCITILVEPININIEPGFVRFKRFFEKPFL